MATGLTSNDPSPQTVHRARYRVNEQGAHVVVVPAHCPSGSHTLTTSGYRIVETGDTLSVTCHRCGVEHGWVLTTDERRAESAEFDDGPYADLLAAPIQ